MSNRSIGNHVRDHIQAGVHDGRVKTVLEADVREDLEQLDETLRLEVRMPDMRFASSSGPLQRKTDELQSSGPMQVHGRPSLSRTRGRSLSGPVPNARASSTRVNDKPFVGDLRH